MQPEYIKLIALSIAAGLAILYFLHWHHMSGKKAKEKMTAEYFELTEKIFARKYYLDEEIIPFVRFTALLELNTRWLTYTKLKDHNELYDQIAKSTKSYLEASEKLRKRKPNEPTSIVLREVMEGARKELGKDFYD